MKHHRAPLYALAAIFLIALQLRLPLMLTAKPKTYAAYFMLAQSIRHHQGMVYDGEAYTEVSHLRKPPVLPYLLAQFSNYRYFLYAQAFLSALLVAPIFLLGLRWSGRAAGLIAALLWALWGPSLQLAAMIRPETLFLLFFLIGLLCALRFEESRHWWLTALAGLAFACAELTRTVLLVFAVLLTVDFLRRIPTAEHRKRFVLATVALAVGFAAPIGIYHLAKREHGLTWVYDRKGLVLLYSTWEGGMEDTELSIKRYIQQVRPDNWEQMTDSQREHFVMGLAWRELMRHPAASAGRASQKVFRFWIGRYGYWKTSWLSPSLLLSLLALVGLLSLRRKNRAGFRWSLFLVLNFTLIAAVTHEKALFREVITPWYLALAAVGVVAVVRQAKQRIDRRRSETPENAT